VLRNSCNKLDFLAYSFPISKRTYTTPQYLKSNFAEEYYQGKPHKKKTKTIIKMLFLYEPMICLYRHQLARQSL